MPLISLANPIFPAWCEVTGIRIVHLGPMERRSVRVEGPIDKFVAAVGTMQMEDSVVSVLQPGESMELRNNPQDHAITLVGSDRPTILVHFTGRWRQPTGGAGLFTAAETSDPTDNGDPVWYSKRTNFDRHFHDCDEYWVIVSGRGTMMSEGHLYESGPGNVIATGMGHHHDIVSVSEPIVAVFFETTMEGAQRPGHLWEHTHGPAVPHPDRI